MKTRFVCFALALAVCLGDTYPACTGADCSLDCGQNCAPPGIPCPAAGPALCGPARPRPDCTPLPGQITCDGTRN